MHICVVYARASGLINLHGMKRCMYSLLASVHLDLSGWCCVFVIFLSTYIYISALLLCIKWTEELCEWVCVIMNCLLLWLDSFVGLNAKKKVGSRCLPGFGSGVVPVTWHCGGSLAPHRLQLLPGTPQTSVAWHPLDYTLLPGTPTWSGAL